MAEGDLFGGIQLDPLTEPPANLDHAVLDRSLQKVRDWFFENFESPDQHTPRDDGDFVYIWGGPWETREIIESVFDSSVYPPEVLEAAIEDIEAEGDAWVPNDRRIQPPEEYEGDETPRAAQRDPVVIHEELLKRIAELEAHIAIIRDRSAGLGHNNPPEPIEDIGIVEETRDLASAFEALKSQPSSPQEQARPTIVEAVDTIDAIRGKWRNRLSKVGADVVSGMAKEVGKRLMGEAIDDAWLQWAVVHLEALGSLVHEWLIAIFPAF